MGLDVGLRGQSSLLRGFAVSQPINHTHQQTTSALANDEGVSVRRSPMAGPGGDPDLPKAIQGRLGCRT
jgi:hypothetical protein